MRAFDLAIPVPDHSPRGKRRAWYVTTVATLAVVNLALFEGAFAEGAPPPIPVTIEAEAPPPQPPPLPAVESAEDRARRQDQWLRGLPRSMRWRDDVEIHALSTKRTGGAGTIDPKTVSRVSQAIAKQLRSCTGQHTDDFGLDDQLLRTLRVRMTLGRWGAIKVRSLEGDSVNDDVHECLTRDRPARTPILIDVPGRPFVSRAHPGPVRLQTRLQYRLGPLSADLRAGPCPK